MLQLLKIIHLMAEIIKIITLKAFIYIDEPQLLKKQICERCTGWKSFENWVENTLNSAQDAVWRI